MRIKEIMKEKGITQTELAKVLGVHQSNISAAVNGNATIATLKKIANALGVTTSELFDDINSFQKQLYREKGDEIRQAVYESMVKRHKEEKKRALQTVTFICPHCGKEIPLKIDSDKLYE